MSVIRKKPFIEDLIEDLSDEQKSDLLDVMNGAGNTIDASFTNMPTDAISSVLFKLENNNLKTGILVQSENYNVLLAYHRFQDMQIFKLDTDKFTFEKVNEYLDINELRRVLAAGNEDGGGSGGSDGSGKLYEFKFDLKIYDNGVDPEYHLSFLLYESNFERLKQIAAQQNITLNSPQDIVTFINSLAQTTTQTTPTYVSQFILFGALVDKVLNSDRNTFEELTADIFVGGFYGPEGQSPRISLVNDTTEPVTYYGLNTNNSCTLTEYGTSASGGTVEAEPIISIKMTNLDLGATNETATGEDIRDVQLYCTKETWDNMVVMAKQLDASLDITYANFGTIYPNLPAQTQGFLVGYLMMDYINGKVLPDAYVEEQLAAQGAKLQTFLKSSMSLQNTLTNNVKVVSAGNFEGNNYFPSVDRTTVVYTTANTVITVEEIEGPAIGSSSGSGTSDVLYKHSILLMIHDDIEPIATTFTFLSKYADPFVSNGGLLDMFNNMVAKNDEQIMITPYIRQGSYDAYAVANVLPKDTTGIAFTFARATGLSDGVVAAVYAAFADNTSITDVVTPYIQVSGGSGSSESTSQYDYIQMCFNNSNNSHIILMFDKQHTRADDIPAAVNQLITTLNQMGSLSIPTYNDLEDLEDIADYLNALDTQTYAQIKVVFWASVLSLYPILCLSIKGYNDGMVVPVIVEGVADMSNQNFAYTIKMMDSTGQMNNVATEQTVFDFDVFVNKLD